MTSRNRTLRCPVSTRYSSADAKRPDDASPAIAGLSVDMLKSFSNLALLAAHASALRPARGRAIDIGQGKPGAERLNVKLWLLIFVRSVQQARLLRPALRGSRP